MTLLALALLHFATAQVLPLPEASISFTTLLPDKGQLTGNVTKCHNTSDTGHFFQLNYDSAKFSVDAVGEEGSNLGNPFLPRGIVSIQASFYFGNSVNKQKVVFFSFDLDTSTPETTWVLYDDCLQFALEDPEAECRSSHSTSLSWSLCPGVHSSSSPPLPPETCGNEVTTVAAVDDKTVPIVIAVAIVCIAIVAIVALVLFFRYLKRRKQEQLNDELTLLRKHVSAIQRNETFRYTPFPNRGDEWEVDRRCIQVNGDEKLGHGAFGSVYTGRLIGVDFSPRLAHSVLEISVIRMANKPVAVKMLADSADEVSRLEFLQEISLMKSLGYHERLVNIIGCITESLPRMLIMEFCPNGDLLHYLSLRRKYVLGLVAAGVDVNSIAPGQVVDESLLVTHKQQLMFALQIVYGLEFLSQRGFVHRDVAARNILLDDHFACKLGDFGLCRHVERAHDLYLSRGGRLPLKWMPPEAIIDYEFSTKSDVWSYAVLLFEIITLGGKPYPEWAASEVLERLCRGERMAKPDNCSDDLYSMMRLCWEKEAEKRPDFSLLRLRLARMLEVAAEDEYYLQLDGKRDYYQVLAQEKEAPPPLPVLEADWSDIESVAEC